MADVERVRTQHAGGGRMMTKQSDALKSDISSIIAKWIAHGSVVTNGERPKYGDFTNAGDFHAALTRVTDAQQKFNALPAAVRRHCENDAGSFLDLVFDPARRGELEALGLVEEQAPEEAPPARPEEPEGAPEVPPSEPS